MRDVTVVKCARDKVRKTVDKINEKMKDIKGEKQLNQLDEPVRQYYMSLMDLRHRYLNQENALNFVLNEDSKLKNFNDFNFYFGLDEFFHDANLL